MKNGPEEPWIGRTLALLDRSADDLDAATLSRLRRARHAALEQPRVAWRPGWLLGGGFAGAALALALAFGSAGRQALQAPPRLAPAPAAEAFVDDGPEFYEDLDFYAWLDAAQPSPHD
jgi:hypothetical protein